MISKWRNQKEIPTPKTKAGKTKLTILGTYTKKTYRKPSELLFPNRWPLNFPNLIKNMKTHIRCKQPTFQHQNIKQYTL